MAAPTCNCLTATSTGADLHLLRNWENDSMVFRKRFKPCSDIHPNRSLA